MDLILPALESEGVPSEVVAWDDPDADWTRYRTLVIRSPWNYSAQTEAFTAWLQEVRKHAEVFNCPDLIAWNLDKAYLRDLAEAGVPVVPTEYCTTLEEFEQASARLESARLVVKPTVSAGAKDTGLFERDDPTMAVLAKAIVGAGRVAMVQPEQTSVTLEGENALVLLNGQFSHAVHKGPILEVGGGLRGGEYTEVITPIAPASDELDLAERALGAILSRSSEFGCDCAVPLYARFDISRGTAGPVLLEAELFEPSLFLDERSAERFAVAIAARL